MQLASAIESGVAQAAALASTMSADDLANKWHERKQRALPASPAITPRSPAGVPHMCYPVVDCVCTCSPFPVWQTLLGSSHGQKYSLPEVLIRPPPCSRVHKVTLSSARVNSGLKKLNGNAAVTGRMSGSPSAAKGPISARFPTFAEHGRKALAGAHTPQGASDALDSSADKDLQASAESASLEQGRPADMSTEEEPSVAAEPVTKDAVMAEPGSLADVGAESDASSSSNDARLQSPTKKAKQIVPG